MAESIGVIEVLHGTASALSSDGSHALKQGSTVFQGQTISTGEDSALEIRFEDGTILSQAENSKVNLDTYVYDPDTDAGEVLLKLTQGTFRAVTGEIVDRNPDKFKVQSPLATIGIRGTHTGHFIPGDGRPESHGCLEFDGKPVVIQSNVGGPAQTLFGSGLSVTASSSGLGSIQPYSPSQLNFFESMAPANIGRQAPPLTPPPDLSEDDGDSGQADDILAGEDPQDEPQAANDGEGTPDQGPAAAPEQPAGPEAPLPLLAEGGGGIGGTNPASALNPEAGLGAGMPGPMNGPLGGAFAGPSVGMLGEALDGAALLSAGPAPGPEAGQHTPPPPPAPVFQGNPDPAGDPPPPPDDSDIIQKEIDDAADNAAGDGIPLPPPPDNPGALPPVTPPDQSSGDSGSSPGDPSGTLMHHGTWTGDGVTFMNYPGFGVHGVEIGMGGGSGSSYCDSNPYVIYMANPSAYPDEDHEGIPHAMNNAVGSPKNDIIHGNDNANTVMGLAGNDQIFGYGGDDNLSGFQGANTIHGGEGDDFVAGGPDADRLFGGTDGVPGSSGADTLYGGPGTDHLEGQDGDDLFWFYPGDIGVEEVIQGGAGSDTAVVHGSSGQTVQFTNSWASGTTRMTGIENFLILGDGANMTINDSQLKALYAGSTTVTFAGEPGTTAQYITIMSQEGNVDLNTDVVFSNLTDVDTIQYSLCSALSAEVTVNTSTDALFTFHMQDKYSANVQTIHNFDPAKGMIELAQANWGFGTADQCLTTAEFKDMNATGSGAGLRYDASNTNLYYDSDLCDTATTFKIIDFDAGMTGFDHNDVMMV